jgi:hypothetical protein
MNPRRLPIGVLMIVPIVLGFGLYAFTGSAQEVEDPNATATPTADGLADARRSVDEAYDGYYATQTAVAAAATLSAADQDATWIAGQPTPTPPIAAHGAFHDGARVRVDAGAGDCLNARNSPSLESEWVIVNICIPDGFEGVISGTTQELEGHWWWYLAGLGWVAEEYLAYTGEFDMRANVVPELSGAAGRVAFLRGNDVWMMDPDGSDQTLLIDNEESSNGRYVPGPIDLRWSPDGTMLSYNTYRYDPQGVDPGRVDLHILTPGNGERALEQVYEGLAGGGWSADSVHLGVVREPTLPGMEPMQGIPAILDVTAGSQLVLGSTPLFQQKPPSFNFDGSLLMVHESTYDVDAYSVEIVIYTADGAVHDRIDFSSASLAYASAVWSPTSNRIAMHLTRQTGDVTSGYAYQSRYEFYDVGARTFFGAAEPPAFSERVGGKCGGGDMWNTEWNMDGARVLYSFADGDAGANGIWAWDIASGEQRVLYGAYPSAPAAGPGSLLMFAASGTIVYGTSDGGFPRIITDGSSPVWYVLR